MPSALGPDLNSAIEELYEAFKEYPLPASMTPCPCCHSVDSERPLYSRPLRELRPKDLEQYARDALLVWGGVNEFKHFLPRIFEIAAFGAPLPFPEREIVFSKLDHGEWRAWPRQEQQSVQNFLLKLWRSALEQPPCRDLQIGPETEGWLCALAQTRADLSPYLNQWLEATTSSPNAAWNLAALIYRTGLPQSRFTAMSAFWQDHEEQLMQVSAWLHSDAVQKSLETAAHLPANQAFAEELLAAAATVS